MLGFPEAIVWQKRICWPTGDPAGSPRAYAALFLAVLLQPVLVGCGLFGEPPAPPANQRYWRETAGVGEMVVLHWGPSADARSYTIYHINRTCARHPTRSDMRNCVLRNKSGENVPIECPDYDTSLEEHKRHCARLRETGETFTVGETRTTTAAVFTRALLPGRMTAIPELYVVSCNRSGCSEIDTGNPAQLLPDPEGLAPSTPSGLKAKKITNRAGDALVEWKTVEGATFYELWVGPDFSLADKIPSYGLEYDYDSNINDPDGKISVDTNRHRGLFGVRYTTSWKVRACTKAGCSPFSDIVTID